MKDFRRNDLSVFDPAAAAAEFMELGLQPNEILPHDNLWPLLGMTAPDEATLFEDGRRMQLVKAERLDKLKRYLLEHYLVDFDNVRGEGYRIIPPGEQVKTATEDTRSALQNKLARGERRMRYVRTDGFTDAQKKEQADALNRAARLKEAVRKKANKIW